MSTDILKVFLVAPSGSLEEARYQKALINALKLNVDIVHKSANRAAHLSFINGTKKERLAELSLAESKEAKAIWCLRGGCGAIELWPHYEPDLYKNTSAPLIGYSDISLLHLKRFYHARRIGIHGPNFFDLDDETRASLPSIKLLIDKNAERLSYPSLRSLNHFVPSVFEGELIVMNLTTLQCAVGLIEPEFLRGTILALEDINEPHYKIYRAMHHLKSAGFLFGLRALILGQFNLDRSDLIKNTMIPLADELGIPLFDWPIFGHEKPNWPLLFGAKSRIRHIDHDFYTLNYLEQHDHSPLVQDT